MGDHTVPLTVMEVSSPPSNLSAPQEMVNTDKTDASNLILEQEDLSYTQQSVLNVRRASRNTTEENGVSLRRKRRAIKGFKRRMLNSPLTKKIPRKKVVVLTTERAKKGAAKTIAFMLHTLDKTPKLGKRGSRLDGKKPPFMPDRDLEQERKFLTSAGTDAFEKQKELNRNAVSRNSTRPGTAVSRASIMSDRIEMQTNYVETRHKEKISAGKKRRFMKSAEKFLDKSTTPEKRAKARAKSVTMEEILRWKDECKLDFAVEDLHRYAVYRDERKRRGLKSRFYPHGSYAPSKNKPSKDKSKTQGKKYWNGFEKARARKRYLQYRW